MTRRSADVPSAGNATFQVAPLPQDRPGPVSLTVDEAYLAGLWVPSPYGSRFTIASRLRTTTAHVPEHRLGSSVWPAYSYQSEIDLSFLSESLDEAQAECARRNATFQVAPPSKPQQHMEVK